jgi:hypothetical protein
LARYYWIISLCKWPIYGDVRPEIVKFDSEQKKAVKIKAVTEEKVDPSLAPAKCAYEKAVAPARQAYEETIGAARHVYEESTASAWRAYEQSTATARATYQEAQAVAFLDASRTERLLPVLAAPQADASKSVH